MSSATVEPISQIRSQPIFKVGDVVRVCITPPHVTIRRAVVERAKFGPGGWGYFVSGGGGNRWAERCLSMAYPTICYGEDECGGCSHTTVPADTVEMRETKESS
jgi:hypothetical protein